MTKSELVKIATSWAKENNMNLPPWANTIGIRYDDKIVTQKGEKIFLEWDDYAFKLLVEQADSAKPLEHGGSIVAYMYDNYNYEKLKLFFLLKGWNIDWNL